MAEAVDDAELGEEVVLALRAGAGELLDGHLDGAPGAAGAGVVADHHAPVHDPVPALPQLHLLVEVVGGLADLAVLELPRPAGEAPVLF